MKHSSFQISGYFEFAVSSEGLGSAIYVHQKGPIIISFPHLNEEIIYNYPIVKLCNAKNENNRSCYWSGCINVVDVKNNLRGIIKFAENNKKIHEIKGLIFNYKFAKDYKFIYTDEINFGKKINLKQTKNYKVIDRISGSWLENVVIGGEEYWNIEKVVPDWIRPMKCCLPSDGRFREDLIWLFRSFYCANNEEERLKYENLSQEWKLLLEKFHRLEREIRIKNK
jgi:hypothetical protein